jgi:magnesium-transporting ATPase (P-type)
MADADDALNTLASASEKTFDSFAENARSPWVWAITVLFLIAIITLLAWLIMKTKRLSANAITTVCKGSDGKEDKNCVAEFSDAKKSLRWANWIAWLFVAFAVIFGSVLVHNVVVNNKSVNMDNFGD